MDLNCPSDLGKEMELRTADEAPINTSKADDKRNADPNFKVQVREKSGMQEHRNLGTQEREGV